MKEGTRRGRNCHEREMKQIDEREYAKSVEMEGMEGIADPKLFWELFHIKDRLADLESPFERDANWEGKIDELDEYDAICEIKAHQNEVIYMIYMKMMKLDEEVRTLKAELSKFKNENK